MHQVINHLVIGRRPDIRQFVMFHSFYLNGSVTVIKFLLAFLVTPFIGVMVLGDLNMTGMENDR
jgi:hypothetical protein